MNRRADSPLSTDKSLLRLDIIQEQASTGRSIGANSPANHKVHEYGRILICSQVYDFFCRAWLIRQTCCGFAFSQRSGSNSFNASGVGLLGNNFGCSIASHSSSSAKIGSDCSCRAASFLHSSAPLISRSILYSFCTSDRPGSVVRASSYIRRACAQQATSRTFPHVKIPSYPP